jgi:hypothetical protein
MLPQDQEPLVIVEGFRFKETVITIDRYPAGVSEKTSRMETRTHAREEGRFFVTLCGQFETSRLHENQRVKFAVSPEKLRICTCHGRRVASLCAG